MKLARKLIVWIFPLFVLAFLLTVSEAYLNSVRVEEIPFKRTPPRPASLQGSRASGIHLISSLEHRRTFLQIFQVPCK